MKCKKQICSFLFLILSAVALAGCGSSQDADDGGQEAYTTEANVSEDTVGGAGGNSSSVNDEATGNNGEDGTPATENGAGAGVTDDASGDAEDAADEVGGAVEDVGEAAEDAVDDIADGAGDAIDNLGGGSFDSYDDAKEYLLDKLSKDNASATYELRDETEDLTSYHSTDSDAEGYQFSVYETDTGEKIGIYYVDKDTGKIYRYMGKNSIEAY